MTYEIQIGEVYDISLQKNRPKQTIHINEDQRRVIMIFASTRMDADVNTVYRLNDIEFKIIPLYESGL
jgi:hypothetical protein